MIPFTYGSSPKDSIILPHLGSLETSIIGENVALSPSEDASKAAIEAASDTSSG
jgi:hypothetical protein